MGGLIERKSEIKLNFNGKSKFKKKNKKNIR